MKKVWVLIMLFSDFLIFGQSNPIIRAATTSPNVTTQAIIAPIITPPAPNSIWFDYDVHGNQIKRRQVYLASLRSANNNYNPPQEIKEEDKKFEESDIYSDIKYFPNPVVEILYVQWKNENNWFVNNINVFDLSGQLMGNLQLDRNSEQIEVDFRSYPTGLYELVLVYNDGKQKTLKIVKK